MHEAASRHILILLAALMLLAGCSDDLLPEEGTAPPPGADMSKFWYSRSRSAQENGVMMRHHALGFSYQAISGEKCNIGDVMCQVLNLDYLERNRLCVTSDETETVNSSYVQRGVADYVHGTTWQTNLSTDLVLYQGEKRKQHFLIETINDSTLIMNNTLGLQTQEREIRLGLLFDNEDIPGELSEHPDEVLSENFRYALRKLKAERENVAVIDSFLNIFGTHVVTRVDIGGTCDLAVKTSKRFVSTYLEEQEYSKDAVNLFFKKMESIEKLSNQTSYRNLFKTAEIDLKVRGGDLSHFDRLIANPSFENAQASYANYSAWAESLVKNVGKGWDEGAELIDMEVTPIYEFIPDKDLAKRVKVRMEASAQDMRDLYGDLNFTSAVIKAPTSGYVKFDIYPNIHDFSAGFYNSACKRFGNGICHTVCDEDGSPSRIVAVTYKEYIPELVEGLCQLYEPVYVTYPVYENRIQMTEGLATAANGIYRVGWLYERFVVEDLGISYSSPEIDLYLYKDRLFVGRPDIAGEQWHDTKRMPEYEWHGSLTSEGTITYDISKYFNYDCVPVIKVMDKFYIRDYSKISNLPGWHYNENQILIPEHYLNGGIKDIELFYKKSGLNDHGTQNRMVRNDNYRYHIIRKELHVYR